MNASDPLRSRGSCRSPFSSSTPASFHPDKLNGVSASIVSGTDCNCSHSSGRVSVPPFLLGLLTGLLAAHELDVIHHGREWLTHVRKSEDSSAVAQEVGNG